MCEKKRSVVIFVVASLFFRFFSLLSITSCPRALAGSSPTPGLARLSCVREREEVASLFDDSRSSTRETKSVSERASKKRARDRQQRRDIGDVDVDVDIDGGISLSFFAAAEGKKKIEKRKKKWVRKSPPLRGASRVLRFPLLRRGSPSRSECIKYATSFPSLSSRGLTRQR